MGTKKIRYFKGLERKLAKAAQEIRGFIDYWSPVLGLSGWTFDVNYVPGLCSDASVRARCAALFEYRTAKLEFFLSAYIADLAIDREDTVVHELVHCLIDPLNVDETARKMLEMVVVDVTKSLIRLKYRKGKR